MKIAIIGATGFIGNEVLTACQKNPSITKIVAITRRPLPQEILHNSKIIPLIVIDYRALSDDAKSILRDASGAIWALRASSPEVELEYPLAFVKAIQTLREPTEIPFRYVHVSGVMAEKDQTKPLWFLQDGRRVKGLAEIKLQELATKGSWETYIARPSMVVPSVPGYLTSLAGWMLGSIRVDDLAKAMIDMIVHGAEQRSFENDALVEYAAGVQ